MTAVNRILPQLGLRRTSQVTLGFIAGGLGAYWPQFPELRPVLERSAATIAKRLAGLGAGKVIDAGFVSDAQDGERAAQRLREADCDLIVCFCATYLTATMLLPIAQRSGAPVLLLNLAPSESMDHASFTTGDWLAYCGACPLPELANAFQRCGIKARVLSGYLEEPAAWDRLGVWVHAASARAALRRGRHGLLGHLYPGMLDVSTDPTLVSAQFGGHVEILEIDDLRVRVEAVPDPDVEKRVALTREVFECDASVTESDLRWAAQVSIAMDLLVEDFGLDSLAYYHRGIGGEAHERVAAAMILGASLLTARGIPTVGELDLRTSLAMLVLDRLGAEGSFTEIQALDFRAGVVEMGHDGPANLAIGEGRPLLRGLSVYHGKRGWGVSVELDVRHGPVTAFGIGEQPDGRYRFIASEGHVVDGPRLAIGNTTSRVDFGCHPGNWTDAWSVSGIGHHWALSTGHRLGELSTVGDLLGVEMAVIGP